MNADSVEIEVAGSLNEAGEPPGASRVNTGPRNRTPFSAGGKPSFRREQRLVLEAVKGMLGDYEYGLEEPARLTAGKAASRWNR